MKFFSSSIILLFILISSSTYSQTINSKFVTTQENTNVKEGDIVEAKLIFWPVENADLSQFKKLEKTLFFNSLYLAQILSLETSSNNADVVELKALFIVKSAKSQSPYVFKYNETPIEVKINEIKIQELKGKDQKYIVLDQSLSASRLVLIIVLSCAVLLSIVIFKRKKIKELFNKLRPDASKRARKKYDAMFRTANKREDFEIIYKDKEYWLKLLENRAPAYNEFFKVLNQYQFKKEWSNDDYSEVRSSFDIIRRSFEK